MSSQLRTDPARFDVYPDIKGRYGVFGGRYVPETLVPALDRLQAGVTRHLHSADFQAEFAHELKTWVGRPTADVYKRQACGLPVIKHGNRSISSRSGSADVIEQLGFRLPLDEEQAGECFAATGFTFLFAPYFHPAMKSLAPVRAALGLSLIHI